MVKVVTTAKKALKQAHCQPNNAAYLNLIEPWWRILRSLALKGRRFETWEEICVAIEAATRYWNAHRHPFIWGRRRRHRPCRAPGIASGSGSGVNVAWVRPHTVDSPVLDMSSSASRRAQITPSSAAG
jgi:hypothetical protein